MNFTFRSLAHIIMPLMLTVAPGEARTPHGRGITGLSEQADFNGSRAVIISGDSGKAVSFV